MLKEVKNNVYNALFVAADEEGQRNTIGASFLCSPLKLFLTPPQWRGFCIQQAPGQTPRGFSVSCKCEQAIYF